jgi:4'-phosphopantetheinyl transferase EntD
MPKRTRTKKKVARKQPPVPHAIIGAIEHHHVQAIAAVVPKEPVVIVALPKSTWQKIKDWLSGE